MDIAKRLKIEQAHLSERITELKKANQISQKKLAELSGLSVRLIRRIEKEEANPELKTILRLSIGLKVAVVTLFDYKDQIKRASSIRSLRNLEKQLATEREKLGIRISKLCKHRNINQEELGVLSKIASSDISLYISGAENLVLLTLLKIAIALEIEIVDLFNYDGTMPDNKTFRGKIQF
jgi:transcriptional regulator with XRE-family HTH domain